VFPGLTLLECVRMGALCHRRFSVGTRCAAGRRCAISSDGDARALELLEFVGLGGKGSQLARALSYGEQRLLEVAVCLAADPATAAPR
jgi:branched-chain amino acid transport system ATP-binding protein